MDPMPRGSPLQGEALARACAEQVLARLFERLNIDIADREEVRKLGRDLQYLRARRETTEDSALRRRTAVWTSTAAALAHQRRILGIDRSGGCSAAGRQRGQVPAQYQHRQQQQRQQRCPQREAVLHRALRLMAKLSA